MREVLLRPLLRIVAFLLLTVGAWAGCRCRPEQPAHQPSRRASLRLVVVSNAAGALEPCGCVKDMLGGVDHAAAHLRSQRDVPSLVLGAGPMLFMDPVIKLERRAQDTWKAEAMSGALQDMGLRAWAPAANDFAAGVGELARLSEGGMRLLGGNLKGGPSGMRNTARFRVGNTDVGVVGVSVPWPRTGVPGGITLSDPAEVLRAAAKEFRGAQIPLRVALVSMARGEALRLAENIPDFQLMVLGKPSDQGESNDPVTPPTQVGRTLVVEAPNHLQALYEVDLFVENGSFDFSNAAARTDREATLDRRIQELEQRIGSAEKSSGVAAGDLQARRRDLAELREQRKAAAPAAPVVSSRYETRLVEIREKLGSDAGVAARLSEYYRKVNEHNRVAFQELVPPAVAQGQSGYVGAESCSTCHREEHAFWSKTPHAKAYSTLSSQHKQFNLDCVSCHVTGYAEPGGSMVVKVAGLENVQCEVCHGPGSRHLNNPHDLKLINGHPEPALCASKCHHVPHVKPDWSVGEAWMQIVGPGHGR